MGCGSSPQICAPAQNHGAAAQPIATQGRSYTVRASLDSKTGANLRQSRILRMPIMKKQAHLHH